MATSDGIVYVHNEESDKLKSLKAEFERHLYAMKRLEAAIKFLEDNPGAQALMNSL